MRIRWRPKKLPLAAKSQVLFGIAALLIIGAALAVQFQQIAQLTAQLNFVAGRAIAQREIDEHINRSEIPFHPIESSTTRPTTLESVLKSDPPKFLSVADVEMLDEETYERHALARFIDRPERANFGRLEETDAGDRFRYFEPLRFGESCMKCHSVDSTQSSNAGLMGILSINIPSQISTQQIVLNRVFLLTAALLAGLTAIIVLSFIITRLILRPVRVLQETAEKVSGGDLNVRANISSGDEFQQLAETFNRMLRNLEQGAEQLRAVNQSLDMQIVKLSESNVGLAEANRLKSEFLASVSHELRTPLNSILGFADLLRESASSDPKIQRYLQNIVSGGQNLLDLINDLLDLAKIEAGRAEVRVTDFSLRELFEGLIGLLKPLAEKRQLIIRETVSADVPIIRSDAPKLQQVLYNLLSNAIKISPDRQVIELIASREDNEHVRITVIDHGPGIAPEDQAIIFEKFRQVDQGVTRKHGGTGLGLSISRELVRLLDGSIGVESELGKGAAFWVILPISIESGERETRPLSLG